jgi:hypothetical protein
MLSGSTYVAIQWSFSLDGTHVALILSWRMAAFGCGRRAQR